MLTPPIRFTTMGDVRIAYQVLGDGPIDVMFQPGWQSHLEILSEHPAVARFFRRLASFSRLILFDWRGTGLSERGAFSRRDGVEDITTVLETVGSPRCWFIGCAVAARVGVLFVTSSPERASGLITIGGHPATIRDEDYPWGTTQEEMDSIEGELRSYAGQEEEIAGLLAMMAPSASDDPATVRWWNRLIRAAMSPSEAISAVRADAELDVRPLLGSVRVPTLVLHRVGDRGANVGASRYLADRIPGARLIELEGEDHLPYFGDQDSILDSIEEYVTGKPSSHETERGLATMLFTDIVGSTALAAELGDRRWRDLLDLHDEVTLRVVEAHGGRLVDRTGDGILATFDSPARAIRCAVRLKQELAASGIDTRAGLHTGEIELRGDEVGGLAVHIAARVSSLAGTGEILVSRTVADILSGSGFRFTDRGEHPLKGVPGQWRVFAVEH
jgi:class 3 adenylate cyclase